MYFHNFILTLISTMISKSIPIHTSKCSHFKRQERSYCLLLFLLIHFFQIILKPKNKFRANSFICWMMSSARTLLNTHYSPAACSADGSPAVHTPRLQCIRLACSVYGSPAMHTARLQCLRSACRAYYQIVEHTVRLQSIRSACRACGPPAEHMVHLQCIKRQLVHVTLRHPVHCSAKNRIEFPHQRKVHRQRFKTYIHHESCRQKLQGL